MVYLRRSNKIIKLDRRNVEKSSRSIQAYVNSIVMHTNNFENIQSNVSLDSFECHVIIRGSKCYKQCLKLLLGESVAIKSPIFPVLSCGN